MPSNLATKDNSGSACAIGAMRGDNAIGGVVGACATGGVHGVIVIVAEAWMYRPSRSPRVWAHISASFVAAESAHISAAFVAAESASGHDRIEYTSFPRCLLRAFIAMGSRRSSSAMAYSTRIAAIALSQDGYA